MAPRFSNCRIVASPCDCEFGDSPAVRSAWTCRQRGMCRKYETVVGTTITLPPIVFATFISNSLASFQLAFSTSAECRPSTVKKKQNHGGRQQRFSMHFSRAPHSTDSSIESARFGFFFAFNLEGLFAVGMNLMASKCRTKWSEGSHFRERSFLFSHPYAGSGQGRTVALPRIYPVGVSRLLGRRMLIVQGGLPLPLCVF